MPDQAQEHVQEQARNYIETIDLQIALITGVGYPLSDYDHALADQVVVLQELKELVRADPSIAFIERPLKRSSVNDAGDEAIPSAAPVKRARVVKLFECSTCLDSYPRGQITSLKCCNTIYCVSCFREWFTTALSIKQLPKCCDIGIEPKEYNGKLNTVINKEYKAVVKVLEAERKLWCANIDCRAFIKVDQDISGFVQCTKCRRKTCATCAGSTSVHKGRMKMCPNHLTDEVLESTMVNNNWKRCPGCHVVVEKNTGCNNISCTCGVMFCFVCGDIKTSEAGECSCNKRSRAEYEQPWRFALPPTLPDRMRL